jgi:hypothetical protein
MLTTLAAVRQIPGLSPTFPDAYINVQIVAATAAIASYLKRNVEQATYQEFYSGSGRQELCLKQYPIQSITNLWLDMGGYAGQAPNAFAAGTLLVPGVQYMLDLDSGGTTSNRGIVKRIGGGGNVGGGPGGTGFWGEYGPIGPGTDKLGGTRKPFWPIGDGNIKVTYVAGYNPVPADLSYAAGMLIAYMLRYQGAGYPYQSESFESYTYSLMAAAAGGAPELGTVIQTLKAYREVSI